MSNKAPTPSSRTQALARHQAKANRYAEILQQCTQSSVDLTAAVIGTVDGIQIASLVLKPNHRPAQLAAMASSLLAVAAAAGREVGHTRCDRLMIESASGTLLVKPLGKQADLVLCMALPPNSLLGRALWATDAIAKAVNTA